MTFNFNLDGNNEIDKDELWKIIESNFTNNRNFLTTNQLDSYNTFISSQIPKTLRQFNSFELEQSGANDTDKHLKTTDSQKYKLKVTVSLGATVDYHFKVEDSISTYNYLSDSPEKIITVDEKNVYANYNFPKDANGEVLKDDYNNVDYSVINDGSKIWIGKPTIEDVDYIKTVSEDTGDTTNEEVIYKKQLFPNEARLKNLTYSSMLYTDIVTIYKRVRVYNEGEDKDEGEMEDNTVKLETYDKNIEFDRQTSDDVYYNEMNVRQFTHFNYKNNTIVRIFKQVPLGRIPIMLHSNICSLHNQSSITLRNMGECPYSQGGYFIINGKEKVIVAQERQMENKLFNNKESVESPYFLSQEIRSSPENKLQPARITKLFMYREKVLTAAGKQNLYLSFLYGLRNTFIYVDNVVSIKVGDFAEKTAVVKKIIDNTKYLVKLQSSSDGEDDDDELHEYKRNQIELNNEKIDMEHIWCDAKSKTLTPHIKNNTVRVLLPNIEQDIPLFILFRSLGIETDLDIVNYIIPNFDETNKLHARYLDLLRPSILESRGIQKQNTALYFINCMRENLFSNFNENIANPIITTKSNYINVLNILYNWFVPHISNDLILKAHYLGYMVRELLDVRLGLKNYTDRDSYLNKRVDISGYMIATLFRDLYFRYKNATRDAVNKDCNHHASVSNGLISYENKININSIFKYFDWKLIDDGLIYAFRNCWGMVNAPCKEGIVQDLSIVSAFGTLSNLRRINTPIPTSAKMREPHSLHGSSWGIMCPSETPDGGNVGVRKNLSMQAKITFDCSSVPLELCLSHNGMYDIRLKEPNNLYISTKIFVNDRLEGLHDNPSKLIENLRCLRRNGIINIYTSILWDVKDNMI